MPAKTVPAPETAIKRAAYKSKKQQEFKKQIEAKKAETKALTKKAYVRGLKYARQYRAAENKTVHMKRQAKSNNGFFVEPKAKVAIVVRIRGINKVAPKQRKILQLLRLRQLFNAVFVKLSKPMMNMLRLVEPYISYGYPTLKTVRGMLYKRGHLRIKGQRVKITDNSQIKGKLGGKDEQVICIEDMVNQIYTAGKHFRSVTNALWPFKLSPPKGGMNQKRRHFVEGGDFGNRESLINRLIYRML